MITPKNGNLHTAREAKNDEFYTQYKDINDEMLAYLDYDPDTFRGKTIYCNCDNPYYSQFFRYFVDHFNEFGLRQLMATNYWAAPYDPLHPERAAHRVIVRSVPDYLDTVHDEWNATIDQLKIQDENEWARLKGCGDFRSPECLELLEQADIVVTNPPFSLFREYVTLLTSTDKLFSIIGSMTAITYSNFFPFIRDGKVWIGASPMRGMTFTLRDNSLCKLGNVCWYSRVPHSRRQDFIKLRTMDENRRDNPQVQKNPHSYRKYDNYDAIEVPYTSAIPSDYDGVMGVPISFMDKYCTDQFEILGSNAGLAQDPNGVYGRCSTMDGRDTFKRIFIRHRRQKL